MVKVLTRIFVQHNKTMDRDIQLLPTREERENLCKDNIPKYSGFTPRPVERLAVKRRPKSMLNIECSHVARTDRPNTVHYHPPLQYKLWLEAGKHQPPFPDRPDDNYNSNVWRNFRKNFGFDVKTDGRSVPELVAAMYPINVPKPSVINNNTFDKYINETDVFSDRKRRLLAIVRSRTDIGEFRRLRARSEARCPPIDKSGNILPPPNFERYAHRFIPPANDFSSYEHAVTETPELTQDMTPDMFGRYVRRKNKTPALWKFTYRLNNPEYDMVKAEMNRRNSQPKNTSPAPSLVRAGTRLGYASIGMDV